MKKALVIFLILSFMAAWSVPPAIGGASAHICKLTRTICKNKEHCPLDSTGHSGHSSGAEHHRGCYLAIYKAGDMPTAGVGQEPLPLCTGLVAGPMPQVDGLWQLPLQPLVVEEVSHTPPERPPQTTG